MLYVIMALFGLVLGSFAGASVWRLRARQLILDKKAGEPVDAGELRRLKPLATTSIANDRSRCLDCGHELAWYDLVPLFSWASTGGKCRYCKQPIGRFEPAIEVGSAAAFIVLTYYWTRTYTALDWPMAIVWVLLAVCLIILFAYDLRWFILPDVVMIPFILLSLVVSANNILLAAEPLAVVWSTIGAIAILSGLYLALWLISRGKWVGFGDVKLGIGLGLLLGNWQLALLALFLANFLGTLVVLPGLLSGKLSRKAHIPFGPLLIAGFVIALLYGPYIVTWFTGLTTNTLMLY